MSLLSLLSRVCATTGEHQSQNLCDCFTVRDGKYSSEHDVMGFDCDALVFYGFFVSTAQSESDIWQTGSDVIPGEEFVERFQRRLTATQVQTNLQIYEVGIGQRCDEVSKSAQINIAM